MSTDSHKPRGNGLHTLHRPHSYKYLSRLAAVERFRTISSNLQLKNDILPLEDAIENCLLVFDKRYVMSVNERFNVVSWPVVRMNSLCWQPMIHIY